MAADADAAAAFDPAAKAGFAVKTMGLGVLGGKGVWGVEDSGEPTGERYLEEPRWEVGREAGEAGKADTAGAGVGTAAGSALREVAKLVALRGLWKVLLPPSL